MSKITVDDLYRWMDEYEEDPIVDGPYYLKKEHFKDFLSVFTDDELNEICRISCKKDIKDLNIDDFSIGGGNVSDDVEYKIVKSFVDTLNKYNYPKEY